MNVGTRETIAKEFGVSVNVIDNMLQRGQLRKIAHGLIDLDHARVVRAGQNPAKREIGLLRKAQGLTTQPKDKAAADVPSAAPIAPPEAKSGTEPMDVLMRARTAKVVADARMSELALREKMGALVDIEKVKREAHDASRLLVTRLRAFPARLGPLLATIGDTAECVRLIDVEVQMLVTELQEALSAI